MGTSRHPIPASIAAIDAALDEVATANPVFLSIKEKAEALLELGKIETQVHELQLRVLAVSQDVAQETGARDAGAWLVAQALTDARPATNDLALAKTLETRDHVRSGLAAGRFGVEHAHVIVRALEALPDDVPAGIVASAEVDLCDLATRFTPQQLRRLGRGILHTLDPGIADQADATAIQRLEQAAENKTTLSITPQGDGTSRIFAVVPEAVGERLRTLIESFAQPRIAALDADHKVRPRNRVLADALGQVLETIDPDRLPAHGGDATTIVVTMTLDQLRHDLGVAELAGTGISAAEGRRLACTAGIIPVVLGGRSEPLDRGRTRRLFSPAQRKALRIRDLHCRAEGCTVKAAWCDAHHADPWSTGGPTNLTNGILLCGHHHRLAHNPGYQTTRLPNGDHRYHRRT